jgi:NADH-quinone oxidoreductase subunit K
MDGNQGEAVMDIYQFLVALAVLIFSTGLVGVVVRRNLLVVMMCLEIMLNAVVLSFVTSAVRMQSLAGVAMTFFIYVAASCEVALAMAIVVLLVKQRGTLDLSAEQELKG